MPAPEIIQKLIDQFSQNREAYRSGKYNEAQLRQEFLDPFFEALGWDVYNKKGYSLDYREVVIEDSLDIEGASKSPDYAFKVGKERKFYVEAKKPKVDIQYDIHPAYQLRRYAWNGHMPLSILTDFEELAVYNCKNRPNPKDSAATGRELFFKYTEYVDRWEELASIFSKEAVLKGAFDRYADASSGKKGTTEVDDAFLEDIETWRKLLAQNIALRNLHIADERQLNFAVQMTIDRIIFLRICEDRGIEPDEQLKDLAKAPNIYPRLVDLFKRADQKYNSGLFHFSKEKGNDSPADTFTPGLAIDDKVFKEIFKGIYYPSEYIFKEIPVEILGQVYEQFLGKVIRLTAGNHARIEEKPEVRKAGGVYYTPRYIVDYIVANTVGKLLEGKTPVEAAALKIVDPACGSGSFLLGAYQHLLDWHEKWYSENDPEKWAKMKEPPISQSIGGWRLTTQKKKEILVNNIHGVDIDAQAVEVTKLSLLLKVLEGETGQLSLGFERVLPDLGHNIQCGNSLIGEDYFAGRLVVEEEERRRVNPFDWPAAFPQVFARGGFDAVIGNPPYGASTTDEDNSYFKQKYKFDENDTYVLFIENSFNITKSDGIISMIVPTGWYSGAKFFSVREQFVTLSAPITFINLPYDIFSAWVDTTIFVTKRRKKRLGWPLTEDNESELITFPKKFKIQTVQDFLIFKTKINILQWFDSQSNEFLTYVDNDKLKIIEKVKNRSVPFSNYADIQRGVTPFNLEVEPNCPTSRLAFNGSIRRYKFDDYKTGFIKYDESLAEFKPEKYFIGERILLRELISRQFRLQAIKVSENFVTNKSIQSIICSDSKIGANYLLGFINSKLLSWYFLSRSNIGQRDDFPKIVLKETRALPIYPLDFTKTFDNYCYDQMVALVERMLELNKRTPATPQEQLNLDRAIAATDRQIDSLVYQLYDLTPAEIALIEGQPS